MLTSQQYSIGGDTDPPNGRPSRWALPRFLVDGCILMIFASVDRLSSLHVSTPTKHSFVRSVL